MHVPFSEHWLTSSFTDLESFVSWSILPPDTANTNIENSRSKLAAGILGGLETIYMKPGSKVLYLGAASGTSVSHVADIVGPTGAVYVCCRSDPMTVVASLTTRLGCRVLAPLRQRSYQHGGKFFSTWERRYFPIRGRNADCVHRPAAPTLSRSLRMRASPWLTGCFCRWSMSSLPMLPSPIKPELSASTPSSF